MYRNKYEYRIAAGLILFVTTMLVTLTSCIDDPPTHVEIVDYQSYLDMVWELYDQKYVGFDEADVNWDALHDHYSQLAKNADSFEELKGILSDMLSNLRDKNSWINHTPTYAPDIEVNCVDSVLMKLLEPWDFKWDFSCGIFASWGSCVIDTIPYLAIKHFEYFFTFLQFKNRVVEYLDAPGMIIDIRMSDDMSLVPAEQIPGIFADQNRTAFFTQCRTGPEHDDLSPLARHDIYCRPWAFTKPIVLLVGEQNIGPAEAFASIMGQMPHVTIIGDTTGGGGNTPGYFNQVYWPIWENYSITCPFARVFTADTVSIQGNGILPDIYVQTTPADFLAGHDPVLEYAIEWIAEETAP